jgi:hypothetical protein
MCEDARTYKPYIQVHFKANINGSFILLPYLFAQTTYTNSGVKKSVMLQNEKWRYYFRMRCNNAAFGKCAIIRKTAQYISLKPYAFIEF